MILDYQKSKNIWQTFLYNILATYLIRKWENAISIYGILIYTHNKFTTWLVNVEQIYWGLVIFEYIPSMLIELSWSNIYDL